MWVVCKLITDRSVEPTRSVGVWPNGATMVGHVYPSKPVQLTSFGSHQSRDEAVKALVVEYYPELTESSIEHIKRVSKSLIAGSLKTHKIVKLKKGETMESI